MKKILKIVVIVLILGFVVLKFFRPDRTMSRTGGVI